MTSKVKYSMMTLFEELYDSANDIDQTAIHEAMKVLMKHHGLEKYIEEINSNYLCIVHESKRN